MVAQCISQRSSSRWPKPQVSHGISCMHLGYDDDEKPSNCRTARHKNLSSGDTVHHVSGRPPCTGRTPGASGTTEMAPREFRFRCHVDSPHTSHVCTWCFGPSTEDESDFTKANPSRCSFDLRGPSVNPKFETRMRLEWTEQRENRHRDSNGA